MEWRFLQVFDERAAGSYGPSSSPSPLGSRSPSLLRSPLLRQRRSPANLSGLTLLPLPISPSLSATTIAGSAATLGTPISPFATPAPAAATSRSFTPQDGICFQSIPHPGCVRDAKFLENGDILTACYDGMVRNWTSDSDRFDEILELEAYDVELSQDKSNRKKVGGLKLEDLPSLEALKVPAMTEDIELVEGLSHASTFT